MSEAREVQARYICLDIEGYTNRKVDAQLEIRGVLDDIVRACVGEEPLLSDEGKLMYLPTGDGMCIALLDIPLHDDVAIHLRLALRILKSLREYNGKAVYKQFRFDVRIGIHSATDYIVKDIKGLDNLAGAGINTAFRVMGVGDGGQILVSQVVFYDLVRQFKNQFRRYDVRVRHDVMLTVYQFVGEGDGLNKDVPRAFEEETQYRRVHESVVKPSLDLGLSHVYAFRSEEVVRDLIEDISGARRRVWLLGIGLCDNFDITDPEVMALLNRKMDEHVDVSILLLDGFRSPAIFRALLESDAKTSHAIAKADRRVPTPRDPFLAHRVFQNFERVYNELAKHPNFETSVRFYGHTPSCWLAVADDKAYYQPYTFGDISADPQVGYQMPVIKLEGRTTTFRILEDHYNKLWVTSDTDLFQTGTRMLAKAETIWRTIKKREADGGKWFEHIHGILHNEDHPGVDMRPHLRQPCLSMKLVATVTWWESGEETKAEVVDFSLEGALLELVETPASRLLFNSLPAHHTQSGTEILALLDIEPAGGWEAFEASQRKYPGMPPIVAVRHAVSAVLKTNNEFRYIRKEAPKGKERGPRVALQARRVGRS